MKTPFALRSVLLFSLISLIGSAVQAQKKYKLYHTEDGVEVYARWEHEKMFHKGPVLLCLLIKNTTESAVEVSTDVNFYNVAVVAESVSIENRCIPAGKKLKGRKADLCFQSEKFDDEQRMSEAFHWKVEDMEVTQITGCE